MSTAELTEQAFAAAQIDGHYGCATTSFGNEDVYGPAASAACDRYRALNPDVPVATEDRTCMANTHYSSDGS